MSDVETNPLSAPSPPDGNGRAPEPVARDVVASALERNITPRETAVLAFGLGLIGILISVFFTHLAEHRSIEVIAQTIYRSNLAMARALATRGSQSLPRPVSAVLEDLDAKWRETEKPFSNSFMCVMDHEARLLAHTLRPDSVGSLVGDMPITPQALGGPTNLLGLIRSRTNWSGRNMNLGEFEQLVAFAYAPEFEGLVAVHVPAAAVDQEIHAAQRTWSLVLFATGGLVPTALALLFCNVNCHRRALLGSIDTLRSTETLYRQLFENITNGLAVHQIVVDEAGRPTDYVFLQGTSKNPDCG